MEKANHPISNLSTSRAYWMKSNRQRVRSV